MLLCDLDKAFPDGFVAVYSNDGDKTAEKMAEAINAAIVEADVVEVVRCKDCEHWGGVTFGNTCRQWSSFLWGLRHCTGPDDFCSYGERKQNEVQKETRSG